MKILLSIVLIAAASPILAAVPAADAGAGVDGAKQFKKSCASCHGADGRGSAAMAKMLKVKPEAMNLVDEKVSAKTAEELAKTVMDGRGKMPAYKSKLSAGQLKEVLGYLRALMKAAADSAKKKPATEGR